MKREDYQFAAMDKNNKLHVAKFLFGTTVRYEDAARRITGIKYEEGMQQFCYWLEGLGHDVPEDEIKQDGNSRKYNPDQINLKIEEVEMFSSSDLSHVIVRIAWSSDIGFGEYEINQDSSNGNIQGRSELMDDNEDKAFLQKLLQLLVERIDIVS